MTMCEHDNKLIACPVVRHQNDQKNEHNNNHNFSYN